MKLKEIISSVFFPERCHICGNIKPFLKSYCVRCGIDTKAISPDACEKCGHEKCICRTDAYIDLPHFTAVYYYQGELKKSLHRFKFYSDSSYADYFGKAMADRIKELYGDISFDGVCFVPMTKQAETIRGYNQSQLLATKIADELSVPVVPCLEKEAGSVEQKTLTAKQRVKNLHGSFKVNDDINGKVLILCDDIKTTGATLKECSDTLLSAGAKDIYCVTLALTQYLNHSELF